LHKKKLYPIKNGDKIVYQNRKRKIMAQKREEKTCTKKEKLVKHGKNSAPKRQRNL